MTARFAYGASVAAMAAVLGAAWPALAQTGSQVEEIIVTAQRVEENLQDAPVAVTAFSAAALERSNVETLDDVAIRTPGFSMGKVDPIQQNFAIRGIGSAQGISQNAGGDPSVVLFVDGIYAGRGGAPDLDALDLERVEVLRGPQGTLFGKNTIGGLVQFVTRKPDDEPALRIQGQLGNYDRRAINVRGNLPINETLALAGGVSIKKRDGYEFNETTGNRVNNEDLKTAHAALRFTPSDTLDVVLAFDVTDQDQKGNPRDNVCPTSFNNGVHCVGVNPDPRITNAYTDGVMRRLLKTYRAEVNWETPIGTLTSLTGWRDVKLNYVTPFFANPVNPPTQIESTETGYEKDQQFSQEVRLAFDLMDERLRGQVGAYFLVEDINRTAWLLQQFPAPAQTGFATYPQDVESKSTALFGQLSYDILPNLTATVGARMTWEEKEGRFIGQKISGPGRPPPLGAVDYDVTADEKWEAFTPRFALDWKPTDDILLYASAARGFKSGGFQGTAGTAASQSTPYDPEFAWSYEAGAKTQWLDNRLRLNLALFKTDYKDLQVSQLVPLCCVVVGNAATAKIEGAELEFVVRPFDGFQIDGSYAWLNAKFESFANGATANFSGNRLPRSPEDKVNIGVQYDTELAGGWGVLARVDYSNQSKMYFEASNIPQQKQEGYINWDGRIAVSSPDDRWEVAVWGKNLSDELVATYVTYFGLFRQTLVPYQPPRTYGVTLTWKM